MRFGALVGPDGVKSLTPPQPVFLETVADVAGEWTATSDMDWLVVEPRSGQGPARLLVSVRATGLPAVGAGAIAGHVSVVVASGRFTSRETLNVVLTLHSATNPPFGALDVPADGMMVGLGALRLFGWALDDVFVSKVEICRDRIPRAAQPADCGDGLTRLGGATFYDGIRPDIETAFPAAPMRTRGGWTFVFDPGTIPRGGQGTFRLYAVAEDIEGRRSIIGSRRVTIDPSLRASRSLRLVLILFLAVLSFLIVHLYLRHRCRPSAESDVRPIDRLPPRVRLIELLAIAAVVVASAAINIGSLGRGLSYDELYTASHFVVGRSPLEAMTMVSAFNNHVAYSILAVLATRVAGTSEWALRLPSLLLGTASVFLAWLFVRQFAGRITGLVAASTLALLPLHVESSRSARGYSGLALGTLVATWALLATIRTRERRPVFWHCVGCVSMVYFHLYGLWLLVVQYATFLGLSAAPSKVRAWCGLPSLDRRGFDLLWWSFPVAAAVIFTLYAPLLSGLTTALTTVRLSPVSNEFPLLLYRGFSGTDWLPAQLSLAVVVVAAAVRMRRAVVERWSLFGALVVPVGVMWLVVRPDNLHVRYFSYWTALFACVLAIGIAGCGRSSEHGERSLRFWGTAVLPLLGLVIAGSWLVRDLEPVPGVGYREALQQLRSGPGAGPVFAVGGDAAMFSYYLGAPLNVLESANALDHLQRTEPAIRVGYHDVPWNSEEHQRMHALLVRRCRSERVAQLILFQCGK